MWKVKLIAVIVICLVLVFTGALIGYNFSQSRIPAPPQAISKGDIKYEVITKIDKTNSKQVEDYFNSHINIVRDYKIDDSNSTISCVIVASNGFMQSSVTDIVPFPKQQYSKVDMFIAEHKTAIIVTSVVIGSVATVYGLQQIGVIQTRF